MNTGYLIALLIAAAGLLLVGWLWRCLRLSRQENHHLRQALLSWQAHSQALDQQMAAMRELRHDLRHYIQVSGREGGTSLPELESLLQMSPGNAGVLSSLTAHYRQQAEEAGAETDIRLEVEHVSDEMLPDLCLVLSNLLENAVEALTREGGGWLRVRSFSGPGYLSIVTGNTCHETLQSIGGQYLSSKGPGRLGIGLHTVRQVARQYGGDAAFTADGQEFRASVFLCCPPVQGGGPTPDLTGRSV